jgi:hypothetical protein
MGEVDKCLIFNVDNNRYYDLYIFKNKVKMADIETVIRKVKKDNMYEWTMEDIQKAMKEEFAVKEVIYCDDIIGNVIDIDEIVIKED